MLRALLQFALSGALCLAAAGPARASLFASRPPALVLITIDTLRADRLSAYGYDASSTPAIDRFAAQGALFETAYCDISWTTGSMSSVMTGLYGPGHGVQYHWQRLPEERLTLAEILKENGFQTAAILGSFALDSVYGLDQGFDSYDDTFSAAIVVDPSAPSTKKVELDMSQGAAAFSDQVLEKFTGDAYRPDEEVTDAAIAWLEKAPKKPFFLWVHYFGPHERLFTDSPEPQGARVVADYDRDLAATDKAVGRLLNALDRLDLAKRSLVVLHSDHGQALGEHGIIGHGYDLHEETVRVPLIFRFPSKIEAGQRISRIARNVDIVPTVLEFFGIQEPTALSGSSWRPQLEGRESRELPMFGEVALTPGRQFENPKAGEFFAPTQWRMARLGKWKYLSTRLQAPCVRGATGYVQGNFFPNPQAAVGGRQLADDQCKNYYFEALYDVSPSPSGGLAPENRDLASEQPEIVERLRAYVERTAADRASAETIAPSDEEKAKLRSLGYID